MRRGGALGRSQSPLKRGGPCRWTLTQRKGEADDRESQSPLKRGGPCRRPDQEVQCPGGHQVSIPSQTGRALQVELQLPGLEPRNTKSQSPLKRGGPCRWKGVLGHGLWRLSGLNPLSNGEGPAGRTGAGRSSGSPRVSIPSQTGRALQGDRGTHRVHEGRRVSIPSQTGRALQAADDGSQQCDHRAVSIPSQTGRALQVRQGRALGSAQAAHVSIPSQTGRALQAKKGQALQMAFCDVSIPSQTGRALQGSPSLPAR